MSEFPWQCPGSKAGPTAGIPIPCQLHRDHKGDHAFGRATAEGTLRWLAGVHNYHNAKLRDALGVARINAESNSSGVKDLVAAIRTVPYMPAKGMAMVELPAQGPPGEDTPAAWVAVFTILGKYVGGNIDVNPAHDEMFIYVEPENVSKEDRTTLEALGWTPDGDCFHRFVSC